MLAGHGSSKTQNVEDALAHTQSGQSLARAAIEQVPSMREQRCFAHCVHFLRLL